MKRRRGQPLLGAEPHNALPAGLLTLNHLPPIPLPIRTPGLRHRLVLRMSLDESYPGIQPTTARKAGDLLTFTFLPIFRGTATGLAGRSLLALFAGKSGAKAIGNFAKHD